MEDKDPKHTRRVRYKGTHPRSFGEKYKEKQPERYAQDVAKVMARGQTPAGMHRSICVPEILDFLKIQPGQTGLDATLGYGGHSLEILPLLQPGGRLYATDVDPIELPRTQERLKEKGYDSDTLIIRRMNFAGIDKIVRESGPLDFVLADLGVSSMQIDNPERGFTFKADGLLDLRLNPERGQSAAALLKTISQNKLESLLVDNSDEPNYKPIAQAIISSISAGHPIETTLQLQTIIADTLTPILRAEDQILGIKKACQRCFQALRISVNDEFGALDRFLEKLPGALHAGGRVAILTFHSGEDRRVKGSFKKFLAEGVYRDVARKPVRPSSQECHDNPRARSAKLRWAIKKDDSDLSGLD